MAKLTRKELDQIAAERKAYRARAHVPKPRTKPRNAQEPVKAKKTFSAKTTAKAA